LSNLGGGGDESFHGGAMDPVFRDRGCVGCDYHQGYGVVVELTEGGSHHAEQGRLSGQVRQQVGHRFRHPGDAGHPGRQQPPGEVGRQHAGADRHQWRVRRGDVLRA